MTSKRFQILPVDEFHRDQLSKEHSESIPLIGIERDRPHAPPMPSSLSLVNETTKPTPRLLNTFIERLKKSSSSSDFKRRTDSSPLLIDQSNSTLNLTLTNKEADDAESCQSTLHTMDTNSLRLTDKFLHELRLKRHELREKSQTRNLSIDQHIALNRSHYEHNILRAQDIFDVHFEFDEDANTTVEGDIFSEVTQEKIRMNIFEELDRQRLKQLQKQYRQLVLGRALLIFITSVLLFMSITLVYVVIELYDRVNKLNPNFDEDGFIPLSYDQTTDD